MIDKIVKLGELINYKWQDTKFDKDLFSKIAFEEFERFNITFNLVDLEKELAHWLETNKLPKQVNVYNTFGQPPVTLFNNDNFVVDLYFWWHADTSIHDHSFSGAFKVIAGKSLHEIFEIKNKESIASDVKINDTTLVSTNVLEIADTHEIIRGSSFNHRLIHIDSPTVTLCVRTINDEKSAQWHHFPNGLSIEKKEMSQEVIKSLYYWQYLNHRQSDIALSFIKNKVENWSISENLNLYENLSVDQMGLEEDLVEYLFNIISELYKDDKWFHLYHAFYNEVQSHVEINNEKSIYRLFEHFINNKYPSSHSKTILEKVLKRKLNEEEIEMLM